MASVNTLDESRQLASESPASRRDPLFSVRIGVPAIAIAAATAALVVTKTGRDVIYVSNSSVLALPWAYILIAVTAPAAAMVALSLLKLLGVRAARIVFLLVTALAQLAALPLLQQTGTFERNIWFAGIPIFYGVVLSMVWVLASELGPDSGWAMPDVYSLFAAASLGGGAVAAATSRLVSGVMAPEGFVVAGSLLLLLTVALVLVAQLRYPGLRAPSQKAASTPSVSIGVLALTRNAYIRMLATVMVVSGFAGVLIEFWFYVAAASSSSTEAGSTNIFASYYLLLNILGLFVQLAVVPSLQRRIGLGTSLVVLPSALTLGAAFVASQALPPFGFRLIESSLKNSIQRSTWEQSYVLVAGAVRSTVKLMVDGIAFRGGEGMAAILLLLLGPLALSADQAGLSFAAACALVLSLVLWVFVSLRLRALVQSQERCMIDQHLHPETHPPDGCSLTASFAANYLQEQERARQR